MKLGPHNELMWFRHLSTTLGRLHEPPTPLRGGHTPSAWNGPTTKLYTPVKLVLTDDHVHHNRRATDSMIHKGDLTFATSPVLPYGEALSEEFHPTVDPELLQYVRDVRLHCR
ncbi:hypothetical protein GCM10027344_16450 [Spelaeicoccus albus]